MKSAVQILITTILTVVGALLLAQIIGSQIQLSNAKDFHKSAYKAIEDSNFDNNVISDSIAQASSKGYTLVVSVDETRKLQCRDCGTVVDENATECPNCHSDRLHNLQVKKTGTISLDYTIQIPIININKSGRLVENAG